MNKHKAYRDRLRQDPIKLEEYRRKERERKKMYRDRKADVPRPGDATEARLERLESLGISRLWDKDDVREYLSERLGIGEHGGG